MAHATLPALQRALYNGKKCRRWIWEQFDHRMPILWEVNTNNYKIFWPIHHFFYVFLQHTLPLPPGLNAPFPLRRVWTGASPIGVSSGRRSGSAAPSVRAGGGYPLCTKTRRLTPAPRRIRANNSSPRSQDGRRTH